MEGRSEDSKNYPFCHREASHKIFDHGRHEGNIRSIEDQPCLRNERLQSIPKPPGLLFTVQYTTLAVSRLENKTINFITSYSGEIVADMIFVKQT